MKKSTLKFLALFLSSALLFTSCTTKETPPATTDPTVKEETSPDDTPSSTDEPITVNYYSMWNESEAQGSVIKAAVAKYEGNTGNKVNIVWSGRDIEKTIRSIIDGGDAIDIWDQDIVKQMAINTDHMMDLQDYYSNNYDVLGGKSLNDVMNPTLIGLTETLSDSGLQGVPYQPYTVVFMYNKAHFDTAGITTTPKTWEEFLDVCEKLKTAGFTPTTIDDAYRGLPVGYYLSKLNGREWVTSLMNDKTLWNSPEAKQMADAFADMAQKGYWDENVGAAVWPSGQTEVALGNISMYLTGTWLPNELLPQTDGELEWGAFNFPSVPNGKLPSTAAMYASQAFFIPKTSKNADAAFELLATFVSPEFDLQMANDTNGIPLSTSLEWPPLLANIKPTFDETTDWLPWNGGIDDNPDTAAVLMPEFASLISGKITADQFIANMSK